MKNVMKFPAGLDLGQESPIERMGMLGEDKTALIKNRLALPDIEDETEKETFKQELIDFFKRHPNYENRIDWNKAKTLTRKDFQAVLDMAQTSNKAQKREMQSDVRNIFRSVEGRKFVYIGENDKWMFVAPLNYQAAVFCDSSENQGAGAKWCIGYRKSNFYWNRYIHILHSKFLMAFNKGYRSLTPRSVKYNLKYMIEKDTIDGQYHVWTQADNDRGSALNLFKTEKGVLDKMFEKVEAELAKELEAEVDVANQKIAELFRNCGDTVWDKLVPKELEKEAYLATRIDIPRTVKRIRKSSFRQFASLSAVTIPNSVREIEEWAFAGCNNLASVEIPDSIREIGYHTFHGCTRLSSVTIPSSVLRISIGAFCYCSSLTSITIPDSVTSIGGYAFENTGLVSLELPDSITAIEDATFNTCPELASVVIPNSVEKIRNYAFENCKKLVSVTIPASVDHIGGKAFAGCNNPKLVVHVPRGFDRRMLEMGDLPDTAKIVEG